MLTINENLLTNYKQLTIYKLYAINKQCVINLF